MSDFYKLIAALCGVFFVSVSFAQADEAGARKAVADYRARLADWTQEVKAATTPGAREALWERRPSAEEFGEDLLRQLDGSWDQEWILDFAPPLFTLAPDYSTQVLPGAQSRTPLSAIREAAERFHFESSGIGDLALALTLDTGPKTRAFLEKIEKGHPDKAVQGQAALALALLSRELGDGGEIVNFKKRRMELVRKAIIESANEKVGETTVGQIAENFLFAVSHLDKGMEAPDLLGRDVSGEVMRLSDYRGKPVMLVFWHAGMAQALETAQFVQKVESRLGPKGLVVLGVARESPESLRRMVKDGQVTWKNWVDETGKMGDLYQVDRYPAAWVLDDKGIVQYNGVPGAFAELTAQALLE